MKKIIYRSLAFVLTFMLAAGTVCAPCGVSAYQNKYIGRTKTDSLDVISDFSEGGIDYLVTKKAYSNQNGEVYVSGCKFSTETLTIPAVVKHSGTYNVVGINDNAFEGYENFTKVTIEDGITYIGGGAFWGCWYLESIKLPNTLKELGENAFAFCNSLKSITFPDSLTTIPGYVCESSAVSKVTFGSKVAEIKSYAFKDCCNIKEITLPASLKTIESCAFDGCRNLGTVNNKSKIKKDALEEAFSYTKWTRASRAFNTDAAYADKDMPVSLYLDNKRLTGGYLYYRMDSYTAESRGFDYDDWEHGVYALLKKDSDGNFILDKKYIDSGMDPLDGEFYYCESKPKDFLKDYSFKFETTNIPMIGDLAEELYDSDTEEAEKIRASQGEEAYYEFEENRKSTWEYHEELEADEKTVRPIILYTVKYEQGEYESSYLPADEILGRYSHSDIGTASGRRQKSITVEYPQAAGRAFAYYADRDGKRVDKVRDITGPVFLHPVFVNEDELFAGKDYLGERSGNYSLLKPVKGISDDVRITSGLQLTERLLTTHTDKEGFCIIDKKVTFTRSDLEKYISKYGKDAQGSSLIGPSTGYIYNKFDLIIVKSGGTLIIDGIVLEYSARISVQKGGKLVLQNDAGLKDVVLGVQEGATVEVCGGTISDTVINAGRINVKKPEHMRQTDSFYQVSIDSNDFYNCKTGVIDLEYGKMDWSRSFNMDIEAGMVRSDMRDARDAKAINNGTINVTGYGHIDLSKTMKREHKEFYACAPAANYGTITFTAKAGNFYDFPMIDVHGNSFYNYGTVKIDTEVRKTNRVASSYMGGIGSYEFAPYGEFELMDGAFYNYGTLDINVKNGAGMSVSGVCFPRDRIVKRYEEDPETASHARIENFKGGKINITTDNGCGLALGSDGFLINDGTITITEKNTNASEPSLLVGGMLINRSKITNNGTIGYSTHCMYSEQKAYPLENGYSGKKWTGSGTELVAYGLDLRGPADRSNFNCYVTYGKKVLVDGESYKGSSYFETVFLPVNTKTKLNVKASGFADKTVEFTTVASAKEYIDAAYKKIKAGSDPTNFITVSMTKGSGTADSSVTRYPPEIGKMITIGTMEYSITTSDLKGGTVCFERSGGAQTIVVPDTITYEGRTYKVTMLNVGGSKDTTSVTIGKNVEYIDKEAFYWDKSLKTLTINTKKLKKGSIGKRAFVNIPSTCVVIVPKGKVKAYKKLFQAEGLDKKVKFKTK